MSSEEDRAGDNQTEGNSYLLCTVLNISVCFMHYILLLVKSI